jgi:glycosyltransferase involved in cell wall biosynthesis
MSAHISVIIPIYNAEAFLARCLESVLAQTFQPVEVICVNDGSSDRTGEILAAYQARDPRIVILEQTNQGAAVARNHGLARASGEFIYYLDSDDVMHPQLLEYASTLAVQHEADVVCFEWIDVGSGTIPSPTPLGDFNGYPTCCPRKPLQHLINRDDFRIGINTWSKVYRRTLAEKVAFLPGNCVEDVYHTVCALRDAPKVVITKAPLYFYTRRPNSVSSILCTVERIRDYHESLLVIAQYYSAAADTAQGMMDLAGLRRHLFPNILKQQFNQLQRLPATARRPVLECFRSELRDLKQKGLLSWRDFSFKYFFKYYLRYQWLLAGHS